MNTDSGSSNSEYCRSDKYNSRENIKNGRSDKYKSRGNIRNSRNEKDNSRCNFENGRSNFNECGCYFNICKSDFDKFRKVFESQGFFYHTLTLSCQEVVQKFVFVRLSGPTYRACCITRISHFCRRHSCYVKYQALLRYYFINFLLAVPYP